MNWTSIENRLTEYALLMRLDKPIGIFLLLWPTLWGLWLAGHGQPRQDIVVIFLLGVILMRSAGCVINDVIDRDLDPKVSRTQHRPLAAQRVSLQEALLLFALLCVIAFGLVLWLNTLTIRLAILGIVLILFYPLMKRLHYLPQIHLGVAFGWSILMGYTALTETLPPVAWLLFAANIAWVVAYDTLYAMVDRPDDMQAGIKSSAILFGQYDKRIIFYLQCVFIVLLIGVGLLEQCGWIYYSSLIIILWLFLYQQYLIRDREPTACFHAFLNNHWIGLTLFCGLAIDLLP